MPACASTCWLASKYRCSVSTSTPSLSQKIARIMFVGAGRAGKAAPALPAHLLLVPLRERNDVAVGIGEREFGHAVPLVLERHHHIHASAKRVVQRLDVFDFHEERQRSA